jgi:hypothetical protein
MPSQTPWNEDISQRPRLANSDAMIAKIKKRLVADPPDVVGVYEMNYVLIPG